MRALTGHRPTGTVDTLIVRRDWLDQRLLTLNATLIQACSANASHAPPNSPDGASTARQPACSPVTNRRSNNNSPVY
ncbi:hypothetical protein ACIBBB_33260 [Streptomyces sp. NPDC051217]|uniref:hypothetical protein n=1 Tax=Streptomyces sp. NPDC051217 TaxID=3365644 RepID=UPI0037BB4179